MKYELPLSRPTGKIRIKERLAFSDYGQPVAPTQTIIATNHYVEWQIGYDRVIESGEVAHFVGANGKNKQIYELSEILNFGVKSGCIAKIRIENLKNRIESYYEFIDEKEHICMTPFAYESINGVDFSKSNVSYPLLIYKFENGETICEIIVREKQNAVGTMPMLYFCLPLSILQDKFGNFSFLGRKIESKEGGFLKINSSNMEIFIKMFEIFGLLSRAHQHDCLEILNYILKDAK